jgi:uncharacterized protein YkwD
MLLLALVGCNSDSVSSAISPSSDSTSTTSTPTSTTSTSTSTTSTSTSTTSTSTSTTTTAPTTSDVQQCNLTADIRVAAINIVNQVRAESRNCGTSFFPAADPVVWNNLLATAAQSHSDDMAGLNFFSHTGSDGLSVGSRVSNAGYVWRTVGENISAGRQSLQDTLNGLVNSPGHCANIMNPNFVEMAMACAEESSSTYGVYWTQVFATQR